MPTPIFKACLTPRPIFNCIALTLAITLGGCALPPASLPGSPPSVTVTLIGLNDFHSNLQPGSGSVMVAEEGAPQGRRVAAGGAAYLATMVTRLKQQNPGNTLVVGAGDMINASPLEASMFHEEVTIDVLNQIGLDVSAVGNHEFDKGSVELQRLQNGGCFPKAANAGRGNVGVDTCMDRGTFSGAKFQYLAANVIDTKTGKTLFPSYAIRRVAGVDIGIIGLTTRDTPSVVTPAGVAGLQFADEVETINALVPELKKQKVAAIVVLIHEGARTVSRTINDKSCPGIQGRVVSITDLLDPAIDVVIAGHSHAEFICTRPDGRLLTQTGSHGRVVSKIDLTIDPVTRTVLKKSADNLAVINDVVLKDDQGRALALPQRQAALAKDPAVDALVQRAVTLAAGLSNTTIGMLSGALDRRASPAGETTLGNVVTDAYVAATSGASYPGKPAQIAFTNPGGLRNELTQGLQVTYGQLFSVLPFNNTLVSMDLTGQQLLRMLEQQWEQPHTTHGTILASSAGFEYSWDARQPAGAASGKGQRVVPGSMRLNGVAIDMNQTYRVTVNNFMAEGGDNFTVLREGLARQQGDIDVDAVVAYFKAAGTVRVPALGRIKRVD